MLQICLIVDDSEAMIILGDSTLTGSYLQRAKKTGHIVIEGDAHHEERLWQALIADAAETLYLDFVTTTYETWRDDAISHTPNGLWFSVPSYAICATGASHTVSKH